MTTKREILKGKKKHLGIHSCIIFNLRFLEKKYSLIHPSMGWWHHLMSWRWRGSPHRRWGWLNTWSHHGIRRWWRHALHRSDRWPKLARRWHTLRRHVLARLIISWRGRPGWWCSHLHWMMVLARPNWRWDLH
jgi:hypothetical protein